MKSTALCVLLLLSYVLMFSCGKETGPALEDTYTISGTVTGADSVAVTLSGDASASWTVKKSGESYAFTVATGGTYTVTPSKSGYAFTPSDKTIKNLAANLTQNFDAKLASYILSGTVTGADSVLVTLSGGASDSLKVSAGGTYTFTVPEGGNYTVTPSKEGYAFTPSVGVFTNVRANITQNFAAVLNKVIISGVVTGADSVTVTLSGDASEVQTVNNGGTYTFTVPEGKNFTVTPSRAGHGFTPESKTFSGVTVNQKQDFTALEDTYTLSGTVTGANDVTVTLSGDASASWMVNNGESYSFTVPSGASYTITPLLEFYVFTPASKTFNNLSANQTQNFDAKPMTYTISGTVTGVDGVTVTLSGGSSATWTVKKSGGTYSFDIAFDVAISSTHKVTPFKSGYVFTPASKTFRGLSANQTQNFEAKPVNYTISAEEYFPLKVDATWYWEGSIIENRYYWGGSTFTHTTSYYNTITGTGTSDGKTCLTSFFSGVKGDNYGVGIKNEHIVLCRIENNIVYMYNTADNAVPFEEVPFLDFNKSPGETWTVFSWQFGTDLYQEDGKFIGLEDVTTPAGTFKDCATFEHTNGNPPYSQYSSIKITTTYLAKGIGPVKRVSNRKSYVDKEINTEITETEEVYQYYIP